MSTPRVFLLLFALGVPLSACMFKTPEEYVFPVVKGDVWIEDIRISEYFAAGDTVEWGFMVTDADSVEYAFFRINDSRSLRGRLRRLRPMELVDTMRTVHAEEMNHGIYGGRFTTGDRGRYLMVVKAWGSNKEEPVVGKKRFIVQRPW